MGFYHVGVSVGFVVCVLSFIVCAVEESEFQVLKVLEVHY